jgi:NAD(P)H-hydrate epimerase
MKLIANLGEIDRKAIRQAGIPADVLMENAGRRVAEAVMTAVSPVKTGVILCGPGNNGGDGFVCARLLNQAGFRQLTVVYTGSHYRAEALLHFEALMQCSVTVIQARTQRELALRALEDADFVVDALFGSGLARPVQGLEAELVMALNQRRSDFAHHSGKPGPESPDWSRPQVLAVDLPSGIDGATGQCLGVAVKADVTVTFAAAKPGLYLYPGKACAGRVQLADIGIPAALLDEDESSLRLMSAEQARAWLPPRLPDSHKGTFGHVLVLAGSRTMPGAAILCAEAAMSAGAGLVTLAAPRAVFEQCPLMPEIMRHPLPDADYLTPAGLAAVEALLSHDRYDALLLGPGLGREEDTVRAILSLFESLRKRLIQVIADADALYALGRADLRLGQNFILTPHVKECARLLQVEADAVSADLPEAARQAQRRYACAVVLKSAATLAALPAFDPGFAAFEPASRPETGKESGCQPSFIPGSCAEPPGERQWISPLGNPGMATAGSGDVLAGIIAALAAQRHAQGLSPFPAAPLGVYLHGLAGDAAAETLSPYAMRASDITRHLPRAFKALEPGSAAKTRRPSGR